MVMTFEKPKYETLEEPIRLAVEKFTTDMIQIDESKIDAAQLQKFKDFIEKEGYVEKV